MAKTRATYFETPAAFRAWLHKNHKTEPEVLVGYYKIHAKGECARSMTWPESVAEALCYGWIDGVRKSVDKDRYTIRFTPRRPTSKWSAVNVRMVAELGAAGKMTSAGRAAFEARPQKTAEQAKGYRAQQKKGSLAPALLKVFKANKAAWAFFEAHPPGYRSAIAWWVMQAAQEETKMRRLSKAIEASAAGKRMK